MSRINDDFFQLLYDKHNDSFYNINGGSFEISSDETSATVYINALGVNKDDIDITWRNGKSAGSVEFSVKGETVFHNSKFSVNYSFVSFRRVKTLKKSFENGVVILELGFEKEYQPDIELIE